MKRKIIMEGRSLVCFLPGVWSGVKVGFIGAVCANRAD